MGENKIGKTNFLRALRLILDPSLPDTARFLRQDDFWDGLPRPLTREHRIRVAIDLMEFENNPAHLAMVGDYVVVADPMTARLTYLFQPRPDLVEEPKRDSDYELVTYGGNDPQRQIRADLRRRMPLDLLQALRDAETALAGFRTSPLRPLIDGAMKNFDQGLLGELGEGLAEASRALTGTPEVRGLAEAMNERLIRMVGAGHAVQMDLGLVSADPVRLLQSLRVYVDDGKRSIGDASLGTANLLFLVLKQLELKLLVEERSRDHTFLCIEEPEAHLHPHLQRLVYREFLQPREHLVARPEPAVVPAVPGAPNAAAEARAEHMPAHQDAVTDPSTTKLLTTHSPHVVSVTPLKYLVLLCKDRQDGSSRAVSTAQLVLDDSERADLERYLDVSRGEIVFSKGVLLVEGEAEGYLIPALASLDGFDCDELGITVCSVGGVNFAPYMKLLGAQALDIPFAVLTDCDPVQNGQPLGFTRIATLVPLAAHPRYAADPPPELGHADFRDLAAKRGLFLNDHTLEVDLFRVGQHVAVTQCLRELAESAAAEQRAAEWANNPATLDPDRLLLDITRIGKGRFAQRLAQHLIPRACPGYIRAGLRHVAALCG